MADEPTQTIATILVATDFSTHSQTAVTQAAAIARNLGARLVVAHVDNGEVHAAGDKLDAITGELEGVAAEAQLVTGHPDEALTELSRQLSADLVVTGTRGRTGFKRFLLGSVAQKVVRLAETNILVARPVAHDDGLFHNILVPTDFSVGAERALHLAMLLAAPGATIELYHAWQYPPGTVARSLPNDERNPLASLQREIQESAQKHGDDWVARHAAGELTLKFSQGHGPAAAVVQDKLDNGDYDLVATGTHGRRGFRRFVLGSVAEATVCHSPCSVLVVHAGPT
jgi:nucleotide-binding universal stress UspA family protein